jgi:hypothetical protein
MIGNEPAFPVLEDFEDGELTNDINPHFMDSLKTGMTIRQYFVAQAMKGLAPEVLNLSGVEGKNAFHILAFDVVRLADACLAREAETREEKP